jgi:hypothetical protein
VPAQGQRKAPLGFENHWIVQVGGHLYDTSYGVRHPNSIVIYELTALAGWLIRTFSDQYTQPGPAGAMVTRSSYAWICHEITRHSLIREDWNRN